MRLVNVRWLAVLVVSMGCVHSPAVPSNGGGEDASPGPAPTDGGPPAEPEPVESPEPSAPPQLDVVAMAAGEAIVFMKIGDECETWQFVDQGKRLSWAGDDLELSFTTEISGPDAVGLSELTAASRGHSLSVECSTEEADEHALYFEQDDCQAGVRAIPLEGECSRALGANTRAEIVARLQASRAEAAAQARARAQEIAKDFRRRLDRRKKLHWRVTSADGTTRCETWQVRRTEIVKRLGPRSTMRYGFDVVVGRHTGRAEVHLTGPSTSGPGGGTDMMSWEIHPITELDERGAKVGDDWWFFSADACEAGPRS